MGIPDHLTCLLRNLYAGQETTVRTRHAKMDWFQIGKRVRQGYILSSSLAFHIMYSASCEISRWQYIALTRRTFVGKVISLLLNMLSRLVITFLPRRKRLLISWLQSPSAVILEHPQIKSVTVSIFPHLFVTKWWDWMSWSLFSECWVLSQLFHSPLSLSSRGSSVLRFLPYGWCHLHIWGYWYFSWQSWFQLVLHPFWHFT